jgi:aminopeptidase N
MPFRLLLLMSCLAAPVLLLSQKMLRSDEWCAVGRKQQSPPLPFAADSRSDSIDILHTSVLIDIRNAPQVSARCGILFAAKADGIAELRLDLQGFIIDSVLLDGVPAVFEKTNNLLVVSFPTLLPAGDTALTEIVYHGQPEGDASGWGGFYNTGGYTFNLGVGFAADPHSFGRAWVPCFDNFVERSTYEVEIVSQTNKPGYSNGLLISDLQDGNKRTRHWKLDQPIPSYLACFAAGPYVSWKRTYDAIPVEIAAAAGDTSKVASTYQHLPQAIECFQHWYGPYLWPKIGYSLVPFNSGAMEHATNVAIGRSFIDGSLGFETLWAHELSHHWWGDLATCSDAGDMWLNEGWAVFSEHLFTEWTYGQSAYRDAVRDNFLNVLEGAHITEGGYRAVSGLPHDLTYGTHVYNKGAVVAHNLRGYLGDSLFRQGILSALESTRFDDWSSADLRDKMSAATGRDLTDFFNNWVFSPGFTHFSIDSARQTAVTADSAFYKIFVKQKLRGAPALYQNVPLEFTFIAPNGQRLYRAALVSGEKTEVTMSVPTGFEPRFIWVNTRLALTLARAERELVIKTGGNKNFAPAKMTMNVESVPDSTRIRVEYHFVMPDTAGTANPNGYKLTNRYWSIDADLPTGFEASAGIFYDGRGEQDQLDTELFAQTGPGEDSVLLLYRPGPGLPWAEYPTYFKNKLTSPTDKYGYIRIDHVQPGQYTIAMGQSTLSSKSPVKGGAFVKASPNPADSVIRLQAEAAFDRVLMVGATGQVLREWNMPASTNTEIRTEGFPSGKYWFILFTEKGVAACSALILR